jgi:hypothetical protein
MNEYDETMADWRREFGPDDESGWEAIDREAEARADREERPHGDLFARGIPLFFRCKLCHMDELDEPFCDCGGEVEVAA